MLMGGVLGAQPLPPFPNGAILPIPSTNGPKTNAWAAWTNNPRIILWHRPTPLLMSWPTNSGFGMLWQTNVASRMWYIETNVAVEGRKFVKEIPSPYFPPKPGEPKAAFYRLADKIAFGLHWKPSPDTNVNGYLLRIGPETNVVERTEDVGASTNYSGSLPATRNWVFTVSAYRRYGEAVLESEPSNPVHLGMGGEGLP